VATYQPYPKVYNNGDLVVYNGVLYQSLSNSLYNVTPGTADWWWKPLGTCAASPSPLLKNAAGDSEGIAPSISVSPNPVTGGNLLVTFDAGNGENLELTLIDISGHKPILKKRYVAGTAGRQSLTLDISSVPSGIWLLTIAHPAIGVTHIAKVIRL
jgi:chitinase